MAEVARLVWTGVDQMIAAMYRYEQAVYAAVAAVAEYFAPVIESYAKANAIWTDRTGNARQALHTFVNELANHVVEIYLSHGMDYGIWLEIAHAGRFQIIAPALEAHYQPIIQMLQRIFT